MSSTSARTVILERDDWGLGFSIIGGQDGCTEDCPVIIKTIFAEGAAARCALLHCGDRLLAVDNVDIEGLTHEQVVHLLKEAPNPVSLTVVPANSTYVQR